MSTPLETVATATTPRGEIALRERVGDDNTTVHELVIAGVFAMDTVDTSTETALAERSLECVDSPSRVLVAGLGLGFTTWQVLKDKRVREIDVVEIEEDLIAWALLGLTPTLGMLARHPRVRLHAADVADVLAGEAPAGASAGTWDLVVLDVDNGPSFLLHEGNDRIHSAPALRAASTRVTKGGALAIWAAQREPALLATLSDLGPTQEILLPVERGGRTLEYALYVTHL